MYTRKLNPEEQSILSRLVELCCEAYWQEAKSCRLCFDHDQLLFTANVDSNWIDIEKEALSLEDYATIVRTLQGIFEPMGANQPQAANRIVTVTLDERSERPIMNVWLNFNSETDPAAQVVEMRLEDLVDDDEADQSEKDEPLDSDYLN